jgi:hypothetical protein
VFCLVLLRVVAANLGRVILSANITIVVVVEALLYPVGAVVELVLVNLAILNPASVDNSISHLGFYELTTIDDARLRLDSLVSYLIYEILVFRITVWLSASIY